MQLRPYQIDIANKAVSLLKTKLIAYLSMEVRTGKSLTALHAAELYGAKKVLFLTKLRAISSIQTDYDLLKPNFQIQIINNESLHKVTDADFDLLISDEHHRLSAYPKPNKTAKEIKLRFGNLPQIYLSGTPAIESGSQWYHSFYVSNFSPFKQYTNFYKWAKKYVNQKIRHLGALQIPDYSDAFTELIMNVINDYVITYTQKEAGFTSEISENILYCEMNDITKKMIDNLKKNRVLNGMLEQIIADTPVKLLSKIHQISNGTVIFESGNSKILDTSKAEFIFNYFKGKKIAIFYFFQKEIELLKSIFGEKLTTDLKIFNNSDKNIALQQVSGSEGISLKSAECLIYYNFGYSGKNFVQSRDRMTTKERVENNVYFVFSRGDINEKIYNVVKNKKKYSEKIFMRDYEIRK